jgi:AraC-like DNA-binding protein
MASPSRRRTARLEAFPEGAVWMGDGNLDVPHQHFTAAIKIGLSGPFRIRAPGEAFREVSAVLTGPSVKQQMDARGVVLAILFVDPEAEAFRRLQPLLEAARSSGSSGSGGIVPLDGSAALALREIGRRIHAARSPYVELWDEAVGRLGVAESESRALDVRVRRVASLLKRDLTSPPRVAALATAVGLSEGRLIHLFSEQMGLPIRQYVQWLRVRDVLFCLGLGMSLTEAAHAAGFADSPHLTRTFRAMFGDPPSQAVASRGEIELVFDVETALRRPGPHAELDAERIATLAAEGHLSRPARDLVA